MKVTFMPTQYELLKDFTVNREDLIQEVEAVILLIKSFITN